MGTNSAFVCAEKVAKDLQSDFQRDREKAWDRCSIPGGALCLINYIGSLVCVIIFFLRLKMLLESGEGGCKSTIYTVLDPSLD